QVNQLAIELTIIELSCNQTVRIDDDIKNIVTNEEFWEDVDNLLKVLNELVIGISIFESDTPSLSKVLEWYYDLLESSGKILFFFFSKYNPKLLLIKFNFLKSMNLIS